jgi:L-amino acid N-acyltransferase YncA
VATPAIRHADPRRDGAACAAIYAPYVVGCAVSFEEDPPGAASFADRIELTMRTHPWLVLEDADRVVGFAYASQHRPRAAYRWAADVGIYVDPAHQGKGAGRRLYEALLDLMRRQGLRVACAGITLPNDASVGLHEALGFERVGVYRDIGYKAGAWHDVVWMQLALGSGRDDGPPPEPLAPQPLPGQLPAARR